MYELRKKIFLPVFVVLCFSNCLASHENLVKKHSFNKVIIWGHKLHSHSHSYIHAAFYKAFKHLGYDTYWFDNQDDLIRFDFSNSLFITEGQADQKIPLRDDCRYILHNCTSEKYNDVLGHGNGIFLQVYVNDVLNRAVEKLDEYIYWDQNIKMLYMPWATDLLPHEIDQVKKNMSNIKKQQVAYYIGYINDSGLGGNKNKIMPFSRACAENNIKFKYFEGYLTNPVSMEENMQLIQISVMVPAIQGQWQCDTGYIPCRIFKNISYGQLGITNSKTVYELFKNKIVYNPDTYQLFYDAKKRMETLTREELFELMDFVKEKHTYLNRIYWLLNCMEMIKKIEPPYGQTKENK